VSKHKSLFSLVAAAFFCMAVLISPVAAYADSPGGLTLAVTPGVTSASLGENISFNYVITSTCNTTVGALVLTDDKLGTISLPSTSLAPGDNLSISAVYTVRLADFPGPFTTNATITGISSDNATLNASATASVTLNPLQPALQVSMSADRQTASIGDNISYSYTVTNTGQVNLTQVVLTDARLGKITLATDNLTPQAVLTATAKYTVLASDLPGPLASSASVTAVSTSGQNVTASATASVTLNPLQPALQVSMSADRQTASVGDNISYSYAVTNTGQVNLTQVVLTDARLGKITLATDNLTPQAVLTATAKYTVLASDLPGPLASSATVTAVSTGGVTLNAKSATIKITLIANNDDDDDRSDNRTKADYLRDRGVPGKGIDHAPGLQKPFNPNSNAGNHVSDNDTGNYEDNGNGHGNGNGNGNGHENGNGHSNGKGKNK
jgi:hypothetical protein